MGKNRDLHVGFHSNFNLQFCFQAVAADFKNESAVSLTNAVNRHLQEANERKNKGDDNW